MKKKIFNFFKKNANVFLILSIFLSFISIHQGFYFYDGLFSLTVALSASITFEVIRIVSIFGFFRTSSIIRSVFFISYLFSAMVCVYASLTSFNAMLIEKQNEELNRIYEFYKKDFELIKKEQSKRMEAELSRIRRAIKICETRISSGIRPDYYKNRILQRRSQEKRVMAYYDSLLSYLPKENIRSWLQKEAAKYNVKLEDKDVGKNHTMALAKSIRAIWNIDENRAKKATIIIIVIGIEIGIVLLALLSEYFEEADPKRRRIMPLIRKFGEGAVNNFIHLHRDHYLRTKRFPKARELSKKNREIRKFILKRGKLEETIIRMIFAFDE